ncbi:SPX domain-containing protein [Umbelopsis sp. PMI_123]|nr:SPX domain-containing protein [Umbelopsis sp. PMI_123]
MKFSHTLQFNAVPEWTEYYLAYDQLKKLIYQLEKEHVEEMAQNPNMDPEKATNFSNEDIHRSNERFMNALDLQLEKVFDFYTEKEAELYSELEQLQIDSENPELENQAKPSNLEMLDSTHERRRSSAIHQPLKGSEAHYVNFSTSVNSLNDLHVVDSLARTTTRRSSVSRKSFQSAHSVSTIAYNRLVSFRTRCIGLYVALSELQSYQDLNRKGFDKILKKHDKLLEGNLRDIYLKKMVLESRPFMLETRQALEKQIERVEKIYADVFTDGNVNAAVREFRTHLRDHIVYERNSVWKDMIGQERKTLDAHVKDTPKPLFTIPYINIPVTSSLLSSTICFLIALTAFIIFLNVNIFGSRPENYCFALLIFAAILWATEAVPLYATAMLIPFLIVPLQVMRNTDGSVMTAAAASKAVFQSMFSGTIMMLLGGFALAAALSKYGIAKAFASHVLSRAGTRPHWVLLANMGVACFLSMWISNVATPVLCFSLVQPIIRTLPAGSTFAPCLILGIALASCVGGMTSPISSPQNIVTINNMSPSPGWGNWFAVALPVSILSIFITWGILLLVMRPGRTTPALNTIKATKQEITRSQVYIVFITAATIALWCAESSLADVFGDTGIIAAIPLFMFFGTGILSKDDLNAFLWSVVVLAQGGSALGNAVNSSGLLQYIALRIKDGVEDLQPLAILCIFSLLILVFATFVSHTVAALIILPIVQQVGLNLPTPHPNLLVMGAGLVCSAGMGLPVSGYPNMSAIMMEDPTGRPYLRTIDFIKTGVPASILSTIVIIFLGYGIMTAIGY